MAGWEPDSRIWREALAPREDDPYGGERDTLRTSLAQVRRDAGRLADQILVDFPEYTLHDDTHLDALWRIAELICPSELVLTPTEAWTLGVAILLHDLGLPVAAYPGGREELRQMPGWPDARTAEMRSRLGRPPRREELSLVDPELDALADGAVLRARHAERARELASVTWQGHQLLEDSVLRDALGATAGQIAASHWWSTERVADLGETQGAPGEMPAGWTVRPVLLAALLRVADAAHLDESRAPTRARIFRRLSPVSLEHWAFQGRLRQAVRDGDRLRFVSSRPFPLELADAWWLCLDHLRLLDEELAGVDAVLQAHGLPRLAVRSVEGARDPRELARLVVPEGWEPVDARVEVSDLSKMINRLGGRALYGRARAVPLRELIQNSCDAVRARRLLQEGFEGRITVRISSEVDRISVQDDGVGMSSTVLAGALLDFGRSLWESEEVASVLPGLQARGFQPIGNFGIGFFSVFMWAEEVSVRSRSIFEGPEGTRILEFPAGLRGRPILRLAPEPERLVEPGTEVTVKLREGERELADLLVPGQNRDVDLGGDLGERCRRLLGWLAPALEVDLDVAVGEGEPTRVISGGDWLTIGGPELLSRITIDRRRRPGGEGHRVRVMGPAEDPVGRGALVGRRGMGRFDTAGALVAGGLRVGGAADFAGILVVEGLDAARNDGRPVATPEQVSSWASEQAPLIAAAPDNTDPISMAESVLDLGGETAGLALARGPEGLMDRAQLIEWARERAGVYVVNVDAEVETERQHRHLPDDPITDLTDDVLDVPETGYKFRNGPLEGICATGLTEAVKEAVAEAWGVEESEILVEQVRRTDAVEEESEGWLDVLCDQWTRPLKLPLEPAGEEPAG